jgi:ATP adenylyltransferase
VTRYITTPWRERYIRTAGRAKGCALCAALRRRSDRAGLILHRGTTHFIILNKYPYTPGHLMIAPYRHTAAFERATPEEAGELASLAQLAVRVLRVRYRPEGFNAGMNLGRSAGAGLTEHYHLHVVPRWTGDSNFLPLVGGTRTLIEDLDTTYERLRPLFAKEK